MTDYRIIGREPRQSAGCGVAIWIDLRGLQTRKDKANGLGR